MTSKDTRRQPGLQIHAAPSRFIMGAEFFLLCKEAYMAAVIPEKYRDLFNKKAFASLGTLMPDGRPQVTPVWVDYDGTNLIVNSAKGRAKDKNMRRDPRVSLAVIDPDNPYRYLEVCGSEADATENGADQHID